MAAAKSFSRGPKESIQDGTLAPYKSPFVGVINTKHAYGSVDLACSVLGDHTLLLYARWDRMKSGGEARKHLDHYLEGSGNVLFVDIKKLCKEDKGVRDTLRNNILIALKKQPPTVAGTVPIPQSTYSNQDWQYALGGINMDWKLSQSSKTAGPFGKAVEILLSFENEYRWHPEDASRSTQCLHQAAENLKEKIGAKDYWMVGESTPFMILV